MAQQQFQQPKKRSSHDGSYDHAGNDFSTPIPNRDPESSAAIEGAQKSLDDIDSVLGDIRKGEEQPSRSSSEGSSEGQNKPNDDTIGRGLVQEPEKKKFLGKLSGRQKIIGGGAIAATAAGAVLLFNFIQEPGKFLSLELALGKHNKVGKLAADVRLHGFTRAARAYKTGNVGETRVGHFGSKSFNALLDRMEKQHGVRFDTRAATGRLHDARIAPPESSPLRGTTQAETEANIRRNLGIPDDVKISMTGGDGSPVARFFLRETNAKNVDHIVRSLVELDNQSANKVRGETHLAMRKRFLKDAWGVPSLFRPLDRAAYKADQRIRTAAERKRAERERKTGRKAQLAPKYQQAIADARQKIGAKNLTRAGAALTFTGGLCVLKEMSSLMPSLNYAAIAMPAMEEAVDKQAISSQMKKGEVFPEQLGDVSQTFTDTEGRSIWGAKALNSSSNGGAGQGTEADPALRSAFTMRGSNINGLVDLLIAESGDATLIEAATAGGDKFASVACSPGGYAVQLVGGAALLLLGPGGTAAKTVNFAQSAVVIGIVTNLFADLVEGEANNAAKGLCGQDEGGNTVDAHAYGNCMAYGARAAHNLNATSMGGVELSATEERTASIRLEELEKEEFNKKSFATRLFDLYEPRSLASTTLRSVNFSPQSIARFASESLANPLALISNGLGSAFNRTAFAEPTSYDWGFPLVSVPLDIISDPKYEDPFENAEIMSGWLNRSEVDTGRARTCFGVKIDKIDGRWGAVIEEEVVPMTDEYVNAKCNDFNDEKWIRTMLFVFDDALAISTDCYDGGLESCAEIGFGGSTQTSTGETAGAAIVGNPYTDSTSVKCAEGTNDIGPGKAYADGKEFSVRLCALPNLPSQGQADNPGGQFSTPGASGLAIVNSRVSGAWFALVNDAKAAGINLTAFSSFRSMSHQQSLCNSNAACSSGDNTFVAQPGYSSHQAGVAIDFDGMGVKGGSTCETRARMPGNPAWEWLNTNAGRFGFKQYAPEAWHWDAYPSADRCGA